MSRRPPERACKRPQQTSACVYSVERNGRECSETDRHLIERCLDGHNQAWAELLRAHAGAIYNLSYRFTGRHEDAQDQTQEIFIKVFQKLSSYDPSQASFPVWLNRIARNHLIDNYRRSKWDRLTSALEDHLPLLNRRSSAAEHPAKRLESLETRDRLQAALSKIPPEMREAVILRDIQDLDYQEIAAIIQAPEGTVKSRISRGRRELARALKRME